MGALALSPDATRLATSDSSDTLLWDLRISPPHPISLPGHQNGVSRLTFSPDGKALVSGDDKNTLLLWSLRGMSPSSTVLPDHPGYGRVFSFSPDGKTLSLDAEEGSLLLWDVSGRQSPISLRGHQDGVKALMFSPHSKILVSADWQGTLRLWDLSDRTRPRSTPLPGYQADVRAFTFSPDGKLLAASAEEDTLFLWDLSGTPPISLLLSHNQRVAGPLTFTPDSKTLVTGGSAGPTLWNVDFDSWPHHACRIANRNFRCAEWTKFIQDEPYRPTCENLPFDQCEDRLTSKVILE
jgi:WD40 repeat protein